MPVSEYLKSSIRSKWSDSPPSDWQFIPFGRALRRLARPVDVRDDVEYLQPVIRRGHGGIEIRDKPHGRDIRTKRQFEIREGDWLMSKVQILHRAYGIVPSSLDGAIASGSYYAFKPSELLDLDYLWYLSHHPAFHASCALASVGVVIEKMVFRVKDWEKFEVLLPPLAEQRKIAAILSSVDDAIAATRQVIEQTKRVKRGLLQTLMTRGIGHTRFKKTEMGEIPKSWEVVPLRQVIKSLNAGVSVKSQDRQAQAGEFGILKTGAVANGRFYPEEHKAVLPEERRRVRVFPKSGRIIISRMNTQELVGESGFVTTDHPNLYLPDRLWQTEFHRDSDVEPEWLSLALCSPPIRKRVRALGTGTSGSMKNISQKKFLALKVPSPPFAEQREMIEHVSSVDKALEHSREELHKLSTFKRGLMQDLLTGRIRVQPD